MLGEGSSRRVVCGAYKRHSPELTALRTPQIGTIEQLIPAVNSFLWLLKTRDASVLSVLDHPTTYGQETRPNRICLSALTLRTSCPCPFRRLTGEIRCSMLPHFRNQYRVSYGLCLRALATPHRHLGRVDQPAGARDVCFPKLDLLPILDHPVVFGQPPGSRHNYDTTGDAAPVGWM